MQAKTLLHKKIDRVSVSLLFEMRDLWVGVYWDKVPDVMSTPLRWSVYICVVPMFPICIRIWVTSARDGYGVG